MSRVFLGRDEVLDRPVAVKILHSRYGGTEIGERFQREGRTAAKLSHPVIVRVYDAGESDFEGRKSSYIVMEYISGGDLKDLVSKQGALPEARLADIGQSVAASLAHAHERGIVHRDIKPANILIDEKGNPRLTDFGIARALDASQATRTGAYLGTAMYSSPEQLKGEKVTPKSDVYSLGVTLYEAATGSIPFSGSTIEIATQHVNKEPEPPNRRGASIDGKLEALILASLAKDPNDRPSADTLQSKLAALEERPKPPAPPPPAPPPHKTTPGPSPEPQRSGRSRGPMIALAALLLLAVLAGIGALVIPTLLSSDTNQTAASSNAGNGNNAGNKDTGNNASKPAATTQEKPEKTKEQEPKQEEQQPESQPEQTKEKQPEEPQEPEQSDGLTAAAAEQMIVDHYNAAADTPDEAWNYLSSRYQNELGAPEAWTNQFRTLESIEFTSGPTAQVTGDTATVSFSTRATHTDRVDTPSPTASLVQENGEWKLDGQS
jgi:serine/threonine-protein kinase